MIGDNPINDIRGSKESINAITFQKIHEGVELGLGQNSPDVSFSDFRNLRELLSNL
jgi:putative hydrolase of the HAD superfamily